MSGGEIDFSLLVDHGFFCLQEAWLSTVPKGETDKKLLENLTKMLLTDAVQYEKVTMSIALGDKYVLKNTKIMEHIYSKYGMKRKKLTFFLFRTCFRAVNFFIRKKKCVS